MNNYFIGTLFLWVYWPTINASFPEGAAQSRAISNTYYALAASCVSAFSFTVLQSKEGKFNIVSTMKIFCSHFTIRLM